MKHDPMRQGTLRDGWQIWPKPAAEGRRPALATRGRCRGLHGSPRGEYFPKDERTAGLLFRAPIRCFRDDGASFDQMI